MKPNLCNKCILPSNFPGITFNAQGMCQFCAEDEDNLDFAAIEKDIETFIRESLGKSILYDIVLAYSGGKDSTYALLYLSKTFPEARIIAITVDNDFLSEAAWNNCRHVPAYLGVDHIIMKPNPISMRELFRVSVSEDLYGVASLKRASAICNSCIQVINTQIINFAANYDVPLVMGGYIGGQIPSHTGIMEQRLEVTSRIRSILIDRLRASLSPETIRLFQQTSGKRSVFTIINPMIYLNLSENEILQKISEIGWKHPQDTGNSSTNCTLNDFAISEHCKKYQYHPYVFEIATMVRKGTMSRKEALKKVSVGFDDRDFLSIRKKLGLE